LKASKPRNGGKWSESAYWGAVRSALRAKFRFWGPAVAAKNAARRPVLGCGQQKWEYRCSTCGGWFMGKEVQVDHVEPCGSLRNEGDIAGFLERLTPEDPGAFQVLCKACHNEKTQAERKNKSSSGLEIMLDNPTHPLLAGICGREEKLTTGLIK